MFTERVGETSGKNIDRGGADLFFCSGHLVHHAEEMNNDNINEDNTNNNDKIITLIIRVIVKYIEISYIVEKKTMIVQ